MCQPECKETDLSQCLHNTGAVFILGATACTTCTAPPSLPLLKQDTKEWGICLYMSFYNAHCVPLLNMFLPKWSVINPANTIGKKKYICHLITPDPLCHQSCHVTLVSCPQGYRGACLDKTGLDKVRLDKPLMIFGEIRALQWQHVKEQSCINIVCCQIKHFEPLWLKQGVFMVRFAW